MTRRHSGSPRRRRPLGRLAVALAVLALIAPPAALAQSGASGSGAGGARAPSSQQQVTGQSASGASSEAGAVGGLPFTALDLAVLAATAAALLGVGVALGRLSHPTRRSSS